jgi:hypothetical protein
MRSIIFLDPCRSSDEDHESCRQLCIRQYTGPTCHCSDTNRGKPFFLSPQLYRVVPNSEQKSSWRLPPDNKLLNTNNLGISQERI